MERLISFIRHFFLKTKKKDRLHIVWLHFLHDIIISSSDTSIVEFFAQMISDAVGEVLSFYYLVLLFGLNTSQFVVVYG